MIWQILDLLDAVSATRVASLSRRLHQAITGQQSYWAKHLTQWVIPNHLTKNGFVLLSHLLSGYREYNSVLPESTPDELYSYPHPSILGLGFHSQLPIDLRFMPLCRCRHTTFSWDQMIKLAFSWMICGAYPEGYIFGHSIPINIIPITLAIDGVTRPLRHSIIIWLSNQLAAGWNSIENVLYKDGGGYSHYPTDSTLDLQSRNRAIQFLYEIEPDMNTAANTFLRMSCTHRNSTRYHIPRGVALDESKQVYSSTFTIPDKRLITWEQFRDLDATRALTLKIASKIDVVLRDRLLIYTVFSLYARQLSTRFYIQNTVFTGGSFLHPVSLDAVKFSAKRRVNAGPVMPLNQACRHDHRILKPQRVALSDSQLRDEMMTLHKYGIGCHPLTLPDKTEKRKRQYDDRKEKKTSEKRARLESRASEIASLAIASAREAAGVPPLPSAPAPPPLSAVPLVTPAAPKVQPLINYAVVFSWRTRRDVARQIEQLQQLPPDVANTTLIARLQRLVVVNDVPVPVLVQPW